VKTTLDQTQEAVEEIVVCKVSKNQCYDRKEFMKDLKDKKEKQKRLEYLKGSCQEKRENTRIQKSMHERLKVQVEHKRDNQTKKAEQVNKKQSKDCMPIEIIKEQIANMKNSKIKMDRTNETKLVQPHIHLDDDDEFQIVDVDYSYSSSDSEVE